MGLDEGVLQIDPLAKYAVAFPRMSRSIFTRANSARSRLISICSALTGLLSAPVSLPCLRALTQLNSVWSTTLTAQYARHRRDTSVILTQMYCLLYEFERVTRP